MTPDLELTFRDRLAMDRTYLAKERTTLAYLRTGLAFIGVGLFIFKFIELDPMWKAATLAVFVIPGIFVALYGLYKTMVRRRERKEFEKKYVMVKEYGK
jgi:putative membrane protein